MITILIHGLGQNAESWYKVKEILKEDNIKSYTPDLFRMKNNDSQLEYTDLYKLFADYCNQFTESIHVVGLSLGGILAIDYALENPQKVHSLILCGTPYEIPKKLLKLQNFVFQLMPKSTFEDIGISKNNFIQSTNQCLILT